MLIFEVRLPLKKPLVTTLTEARALTSRNYEVKQRTEHSKIIKSKNYIICILSFCFRITASKIIIFEIGSPLKQPPVITFGETRACTSRKYVAKQGIVMPN